METRIVGVFDSQKEVINAIKKYELEGIDSKRFSVLARDEIKTDIITEEMNIDEKEPGSEGVLGIWAGFLAGIGGGVAVPGMLTPGFGPLMAAGPMAAAFQGGSDDELKHMLLAMDLDDHSAAQYIQELDAGKIILFLES